MTDLQIRPERHEDASRIEAVTTAAFLHAEHTSHTEQLIVDGLRRAGMLTLSLVADLNPQIEGHAAASPVTVSDGTMNWYGLGPVSVAPEHQRQGVGSRLVSGVLERLRQMGAGGCVVLGYPHFYGRFGFRPAPGLVLPGVPPEYFMALPFAGQIPRGHVKYHEAFEL